MEGFFTFPWPAHKWQLTPWFIPALFKYKGHGDPKVEQSLDLSSPRHGTMENKLIVSTSLPKASPILRAKAKHGQVPFPLPREWSATGVSRKPFTHFSEFTRAGRKKNKIRCYEKKLHHIWSELCVMDEILLLPNSQSFVSEFLLTWKQDLGKTWLIQQIFSQRRRFLYSILLIAKICFLSMIQEKNQQKNQN